MPFKMDSLTKLWTLDFSLDLDFRFSFFYDLTYLQCN